VRSQAAGGTSSGLQIGGGGGAMTQPCDHQWLYPWQAPISVEGKPDSGVVVRQCATCKVKQMAFIGRWQTATGDYALPEHYEDLEKNL